MADRRGRRRNVHPHEISNLTYGHYGTPSYDKQTQGWHFRRHAESSGSQHGDDDDIGHSDAVPLRLLHRRFDTRDKGLGKKPEASCKAGRYTSKRILKWLPGLTAAAGTITEVENEDLEDHYPSNVPLSANQLIYAYAPYTYVRNRHMDTSGMPFVASVAGADHAALELRPIQLQEADVADGSGIVAPTELPLFSDRTVWNAPLNEPILQLYYSPADTMIAYRQSTASTLCLPSIDDRPLGPGEPQPLLLNPVLTLPNSRTGNHPHSDIAFSSSEGLNLGVVDTHGNWSVWRISGKRSLSTRLLYQTRLLISGRLWSWTEERRPLKDSNPFFDGWHKICFLRAADGTMALLVANRQDAMLWDTDGTKLENVDLRLQSSSDWVLDVWISTADPSICFVLTTSKIMLLHMRSDNEPGPLLRLVCMSSHFLGGGDLSLRVSVLEVPTGTFSAFAVNVVITDLHSGSRVSSRGNQSAFDLVNVPSWLSA